jgi:hypothetical protein
MNSGLDAMPLFLLDDLLNNFGVYLQTILKTLRTSGHVLHEIAQNCRKFQ